MHTVFTNSVTLLVNEKVMHYFTGYFNKVIRLLTLLVMYFPQNMGLDKLRCSFVVNCYSLNLLSKALRAGLSSNYQNSTRRLIHTASWWRIHLGLFYTCWHLVWPFPDPMFQTHLVPDIWCQISVITSPAEALGIFPEKLQVSARNRKVRWWAGWFC